LQLYLLTSEYELATFHRFLLHVLCPSLHKAVTVFDVIYCLSCWRRRARASDSENWHYDNSRCCR